MSNNKQSSIEKMFQEMLGIQQEGIKLTFDENLALLEKYKAMHKEEIIDAINKVSENNVKYANMIIASWSQIEGELFMHNTKLAEQYYNETFGGNNEQQ